MGSESEHDIGIYWLGILILGRFYVNVSIEYVNKLNTWWAEN